MILYRSKINNKIYTKKRNEKTGKTNFIGHKHIDKIIIDTDREEPFLEANFVKI